MSIAESDGSPSWSLGASETGESTKCPWVGEMVLKLSTTPTHRYLVLSSVSLSSRDHDGGPVGLNDRHLRSHGKIGDCEQSISYVTVWTS